MGSVAEQLRIEIDMVKEMTGSAPYRVGITAVAYDTLCAELGQDHIDIFYGVRIDRGVAKEVEHELRREGVDVGELYLRATNRTDGESEGDTEKPSED